MGNSGKSGFRFPGRPVTRKAQVYARLARLGTYYLMGNKRGVIGDTLNESYTALLEHNALAPRPDLDWQDLQPFFLGITSHEQLLCILRATYEFLMNVGPPSALENRPSGIVSFLHVHKTGAGVMPDYGDLKEEQFLRQVKAKQEADARGEPFEFEPTWSMRHGEFAEKIIDFGNNLRRSPSPAEFLRRLEELQVLTKEAEALREDTLRAIDVIGEDHKTAIFDLYDERACRIFYLNKRWKVKQGPLKSYFPKEEDAKWLDIVKHANRRMRAAMDSGEVSPLPTGVGLVQDDLDSLAKWVKACWDEVLHGT